MHDQPSLSPAEEDDRADFAVLDLLLDDDLRAPVAVEEVVREIGDRIRVVDAVARLHGAGLIHRCGDFVFATQAARRFDEIAA